MLSQQRAEHGAEVPLGLGRAHRFSERFSEPFERNIEEFFKHLVACDSLQSCPLSFTPKSKLRYSPRPTASTPIAIPANLRHNKSLF
jgi:hypothetical protein